jgi:5'-phosphate synthase pdxT subunit
MFAALGVGASAVTDTATLAGVDAIVIPGGESTAISRLLETSGMLDPLRRRIEEGLPALGTCAGMILLADEVLDGRPDQHQLGGIDISVRRNAFGRQVDSFETDLAVAGLDRPFHAVFIRAPIVERSGAGVETLASVEGSDGRRRAVLCRQGPRMVSAFHPELSGDPRLHEMFLTIAFDPGVTVGTAPGSRTNL